MNRGSRSTRAPGRARWPSAALGLAVALAATQLIARVLATGGHDALAFVLRYNAGTLSFSYLEFGAIRRGLGGTLVRLFSADPVVGTAVFVAVWGALLGAGVAVLFARSPERGWRRLALAVVIVGLAWRWGLDAGRTDIAIAALLAWATVAASRGRAGWAAAALAVGLFIHETSYIVGLPLLAALALRLHAAGRWNARSSRAAALAIGAGIAGYVVNGWLPKTPALDIAAAVQAKLPGLADVDMAVYFALGGWRGVRTSLCQNATDPSLWVHAVGAVVVLGVAFLALARRPRREWPTALLAAVPPFAFLYVIANDNARWAVFGVLNLWLLAVATPFAAGDAGKAPVRPAASLALALALLLLIHPMRRYTETPLFAASPGLETLIQRALGLRTPPIREVLVTCDPTWREVLDGAPTR